LFLAMSRLANASTLTVTNTNDTGAGSLRGEILAASSGDTINFNVSGTITLGSTLPAIAINLTIDGSGQAITVDGKNSFQILSVNSGATLTLHNLTIANGSSLPAAVAGGGIFNSGTLTVTNCTFSHNIALATGGAIDNSGTLTVTNSTFSGSRVNHEGGAIHNSGTLTVTNSTFFENVADGIFGGGAIFNSATMKVTNSTFFENGIEIVKKVANSTISENDGTTFGIGGIDNLGTAELKGTILADGIGGNCGGTITDAGYNISDDNSCGFMSPSINNSTTLNLDPLGLANNGGPTQTIALEPNSEAIDFIPFASCTDQSSPTPQPLTTDQRGVNRPDPGNPDFCDAGAFELTTMPFVLAPNTERLQIARSTIPDSDKLNLAFTFTENGFPACDAADDAFNGFNVYLATGSCASLNFGGPALLLDGWVVHTVNHQSYGTLFFDGGGTLSARMVELPTPLAPACGEWTVNIEIAGIDSAFLGNGPFAVGLRNPDGDEECFDITNAIVGSQTPPPPHGVRRRVRR
jgi:hypothetical protein